MNKKYDNLTVMGPINWNEFKEYKQTRENPKKLDNFQLLLEFVRSYYNINNAFEIFDMLAADELSRMMLKKRGIDEPEDLEAHLFKLFRS